MQHKHFVFTDFQPVFSMRVKLHHIWLIKHEIDNIRFCNPQA